MTDLAQKGESIKTALGDAVTGVTVACDELTLDVNPDDGWSGRVTPEAITNSLTQSRNAG